MTSQRLLHALSFDPTLSALFARTAPSSVAEWADWIAREDPFEEVSALRAALQLIGAAGEPPVVAFLRHVAWCAHREAARTAGRWEPLPVRISGLERLRATDGAPTILIAPMTLATADAVEVIGRVLAGRPVVIYGEELDNAANPPGAVAVAGSARGDLRRILATLGEGGVLCTYPDFAYNGHGVVPITLFGRPRGVSAGFLNLASRPGTLLLPTVCVPEGKGLVVRFEPPVAAARSTEVVESGPRGERAGTAALVAALLEQLIRTAPAFWRLLPTLTFESPQAGARTAATASTRTPASPERGLGATQPQSAARPVRRVARSEAEERHVSIAPQRAE